MAGGADRISNLPSEILERILFFTGVRQAVQLSVLSSRWKNLWKSMPDLYFDAKDFPPTGNQNWRLFSLACRILSLRTWRARNIRIEIYENMDQLFQVPIWRWFNFVASCHANECSLSRLPCSSSSPIGRFLFMGKYHRFINFGMLRSLSISWIFEPFCRFEPPSDASPLLENLSISYCTFNAINISFSKLKLLTLHNCDAYGGEFRVATPSLESFDFRQVCRSVCELENLASLKHASIVIGRGNWNDDAILGVFREIQNATSINLSWWTLEAHYKQQGSFSCLPTFHNAKNVTLVKSTQRNIILMKDLLQKWPNIETLTIICEDELQII